MDNELYPTNIHDQYNAGLMSEDEYTDAILDQILAALAAGDNAQNGEVAA
jgi:hypothetical protein